MAELMDHVRVLADQVGPRPVSTEEEHQTSLYVAQELTDDGLDVGIDEFATPTGVRWPYVIAFACAILGTAVSGVGIIVPGIALSMHLVGLVLIAVGVFLYYMEHNNKPLLSKLRAGGISQNVVAKYVPSSVARERRRRKVIIVAHVDTVRAEPEAAPKLIQHASLLRRIIFFVMFGLLVFEVVRIIPIPWPSAVDTVLWIISLVACVYILVAAVFVVVKRFMPYVSGGNDNASSVAVLLEVAKRLRDPEARERYAMERPIEQDYDNPVETLAPQSTGRFTPVGDDTAHDQVSYHDEQAAYAAGVVPQGAKLEYEPYDEHDAALEYGKGSFEGGESFPCSPSAFGEIPSEGEYASLGEDSQRHQDATVMFDPVAAGEAQDARFAEADKTQMLNRGENAQTASFQGEPVADVAQQPRKTSIFELDDDAIEDAREASTVFVPRTYDDASDVVFADVEEEPEPPVQEQFQQQEADFAQDTLVEPGPLECTSQPQPASVKSQFATAPAASARPQGGASARKETAVPSWYKAAKEKAAKDMERAGGQDEGAQEGKTLYRSRFADMPLKSSKAAAQPQAAAQPAQSAQPAQPEQLAQQERRDSQQPSSIFEQPAIGVDVPVFEPFARKEQEAPAQQASAPVSQQPIELDIPDDQLDEFSPDASGVFESLSDDKARVVSAVSEQAGKRANLLQGLTSRIPVIGSSDYATHAEKYAAHETRDDIQGIPEVTETKPAAAFRPSDEERAASVVDGIIREISSETAQSRPASERIAREYQSSKPERRKPTSRHVTESFKPTKAVDERENMPLGNLRQEAPVSSTYEDTPQAACAPDPFAPRDEYASSERYNTRPALSGRMPAVNAPDFGSNPSQTSSFPSLTGSFPALTGLMPRIGADDFEAPRSEDGDEDAFDDFLSGPATTTEIEIPESRFHSAVDKFGGLLSRKRDKDNEKLDDAENWDDSDDDFGWKGGGYFVDDTESAFEAARERAAQIRESVVSMTESDLLDKEVWFVALGASGAGEQGMRNFLDLHASELRGSLIINLEGVGCGEIRYVDLEGTGKSHRSDRRLQGLVKNASKELKGSEMKAQSLQWRNTDATPAMLAGMRAISVMGFDGVAPKSWHWSTDTSDIVEPNNLEYVTRLLLKVIENS